jgi:hypothetical protein
MAIYSIIDLDCQELKKTYCQNYLCLLFVHEIAYSFFQHFTFELNDFYQIQLTYYIQNVNKDYKFFLGHHILFLLKTKGVLLSHATIVVFLD